MMNQIKLSCILLFVTSLSFAQEIQATFSHNWELVAYGTPVFKKYTVDEASGGARFSLEVGRVIKPNLSVGLRPSYEFHAHRVIRAALQAYAKYRKPMNPKANWYVEGQLGYGFQERYSATFYYPGIGQERIIEVDHEELIWETRMDVAIGIEFYLFKNIQGLLAINTGQGFEFGIGTIF